MTHALEIKNLSKRYRISGKEMFNALDNINLTLQAGEVLGLIGHNGAGKSTLLKILSRITYPSAGEVNINGSIASLLEVGTGFHPELTGKENIFLNGSILGMSRPTIKQRFDEIVEFAGVSQFLDMPVKRYSSGMFVRLAFSVAAHLDAEILLIDEVLAVGDQEFQKKCLSRMNDISSRQERSIIFVSHNMSAISSLCHRVGVLKNGRLMKLGEPQKMIDFYLEEMDNYQRHVPIAQRTDRENDGRGKIIRLSLPNQKVISQQTAQLEIEIQINEAPVQSARVELHVFNSRTNFITTLEHSFAPQGNTQKLTCTLPHMNFMPGDFFINAHLFLNGQRSDFVGRALYFTVVEENFKANKMANLRNNPGVYVAQEWRPLDSPS